MEAFRARWSAWSKKQQGCVGCLGLFVILAIFGMIYNATPAGQHDNATSTANAVADKSTEDARKSSVEVSLTQTAAAVKPDAATNEPAAHNTDVPKPAEVSPVVGADVTVGGVVWKVTKAEDRGKSIKGSYSSIKTTGRFIWVEATVTNNASEKIGISGPKVKDSTGREFDVSSDSIGVVPSEKACIYENANPGIAKECTWIYEVPADAKGLKLQAGDGKIFGGAEPVGIDLGQ